MKNDRKLRVISIVALCVSLLGLTIAYATLKSSFNVEGTATIKSGTWNVAISTVGTPTTTGYAEFTTAPSASGTTVSFAVDLKAPGDSASFDIVVANTGLINAKLESLTLTGVSEANLQNVTYTVTPKDSVTVGSVLAKQTGVHTYTVSVVYSSTVDEAQLPATDIVLDLGASITYVQS